MHKRKVKKSPKRRSSRRSPGARITKLPKGALTLIVTLRAKEGQHLLLEAELRALVGPTRKEEGCLQYDLHRGADQPGTFLFHEVWESREHHAAHTRTPHFLRFNARKDSLLASKESAFWQQIA
ncbi:MAG TPA: putative quinol monooxygenase [Candidatus Acidoferrum sp.]|jgi:quinol monooxygenase YgiN|nr:putative quinol monooxygenase [Candidatus Acidoferrum sp.]